MADVIDLKPFRDRRATPPAERRETPAEWPWVRAAKVVSE